MATVTFRTPKNNAYSTLNGAITDSDTSIVVQAGEGARFPTSDFWATLFGSSVDTNEIVLCSSRSTDTLTVTRGQQSTSAVSWVDGTNIQVLVTAQDLQDIIDALTDGTDELDFAKTASFTVNEASTDSILKISNSTDTKYSALMFYRLRTSGTFAGGIIDLISDAASANATLRIGANTNISSPGGAASPEIKLNTTTDAVDISVGDLDVSAGAIFQNIGTAFADGDTTPSVAGANVFKLGAQTTPISITALDGGTAGHEVTLIAVDSDTDLTDGGTLKLSGGWAPAVNDTLKVLYDGANWFELSRSVN